MPKKFMSIITDGINSLKKNIPHFKVKVSFFVLCTEHWRRHSDKTEKGHPSYLQSVYKQWLLQVKVMDVNV